MSSSVVVAATVAVAFVAEPVALASWLVFFSGAGKPGVSVSLSFSS
jgi:hypothetical protein